MALVRIGEFAKRNGVSLDFIRFYEAEGILTPVVDERNHYHYYDFSQSETVFKIKYYRRLGFSVKETERLLHSTSEQEQLELYLHMADEQQRIAEQAESSAQHLRQLADMLSKENETWYVSQMPAFWFLPHTENGIYISDANLQEQLARWEELIPYIFDLVHFSLDEDGSVKTVRHGRGIDEDAAARLSVPTAPPAVCFPKKRCLEYYFCRTVTNNAVNSEMNIESISPALEVLRSLNLKPDGDIFLRILSMLPEGDRTRLKCVAFLPC